MIELFEGAPGAGKTCYVIGERLLAWVKAGRRVYVYMRGFDVARWAVFLGVPVVDLDKQITVLDDLTVFQLASLVEPGSAVFLDEVQVVFRSRSVVPPDLSRWLETHRHYGCDLVLTCQDYRQCTSGLTRLVEVTWKFRRLEFLGLSGRYMAHLRGNPEDTDVIRTVTGCFNPKVFPFYDSYAVSGVKETRGYGSVWRSPKMAAAVVVLVVGAVIVFGPSLGIGKGTGFTPASMLVAASPTVEKGGSRSTDMKTIVPSRVTVSEKNQSEVGAMIREQDLCVVGSYRVESGPWQYVLADGRVVVQDELAGLLQVAVVEKEVQGVGRVFAQGLRVGSCNLGKEGG
jgi:zona occludens toxin (predicted ATPase)